MTRFALYARYSSDRQSERSIDDQLRLCRETAARAGGTIVAEHSDAELSGVSMVNRPGVQQLMADVEAGRCDAVIVEKQNRLSRSLRDITTIYELLTYHRVKLVSVGEGELSLMHIGMMGTMNQLHLNDIADHTRRGQRGNVENGLAAGGLCYGYDLAPELDGRGQVLRGKRRINEGQAAIVRRIFTEYSDGTPMRDIVTRLNAEGVPAPRGGAWRISTIHGSRARRNGILYNELYIGRMVFNRQRFVKNPRTGKREARPNPAKDWITRDVPDLRIVSDELWHRVHAVKRAYTVDPAAPRAPRRATWLLSGLLTCGACGGTVTAIGRDRLGCSHHFDQRTCGNGRTVMRAVAEQRIVDGLRDTLLAPDLIAEVVREVHAQLERRRKNRNSEIAGLERQRATAKAAAERLVDAIERGIATPEMEQRLVARTAELRELEARVAVAGAADVVAIHPGVAEAYRAKVTTLQACLGSRDEAAAREGNAVLRELLERIVVIPGEARGVVTFELVGEMANLLRLSSGLAAVRETGVREALVAGARYGRSPDSRRWSVVV